MVDGDGIECVDGCVNVDGDWIECVGGCVDGGGIHNGRNQQSTLMVRCRRWRRYSMVRMAFSPIPSCWRS